MWDAWGGDAGVNWAIKKLEQIDSENKIKEDFESFFEDIIKSIKENK